MSLIRKLAALASVLKELDEELSTYEDYPETHIHKILSAQRITILHEHLQQLCAGEENPVIVRCCAAMKAYQEQIQEIESFLERLT